jgi:hypothetical protein
MMPQRAHALRPLETPASVEAAVTAHDVVVIRQGQRLFQTQVLDAVDERIEA